VSELTDLIADLVAIDSVNPDLVPGGAGEREIARVVAEWLERRGLEVRVEYTEAHRPNVVGRTRGTHGGRTLLLLAHTDTVGTAGMQEPFAGRVEGGRLYGRGAYDMKSGLAAAMCAAADLTNLTGQVVVAAVCDEEAGGSGTRALLASSGLPDAAIVTEPTDLTIATAHKGFVAFEIETVGRAAHGSRPDLGVDAILGIGPVLVEPAELNRKLQRAPPHPLLGTASLHASLIEGGREASSYPQRCLLTGEWRILPGDNPSQGLDEAIRRSGVPAELRLTYQGDPFGIAADAEIVETVRLRPAGRRSPRDGRMGRPRLSHQVRDVMIATALDFCQRTPDPAPT
jgi:acetylornithine deacetylase